jgi:hypothetical protein
LADRVDLGRPGVSRAVSRMESRAGPEDQVSRHREFCRRHPEVTTGFDRQAGVWRASWPDGRKGTREISQVELRDLLDNLERVLGS